MFSLRNTAVCAGFVAVALAAGCADMQMPAAAPVQVAAAAAKAVPAVIPDATLVENVKATLASPALNASHLNVSAKSGEITLSGDVESGQQLAKIAIAVQKLPGVKAVIPDMTPKR